jgi:hypothetical protein
MARSVVSSTIDSFVSSSEVTTEEEVTHPIGQDRVKLVVWKGKGNEESYSQSEPFFTMGGIMSTLKKLNTTFTKPRI